MMKRKIKFLLVIIMALFAALLLAAGAVNMCVVKTAEKYMYSPDEAELLPKADCIIVLGAGLRPDGSPSHMLRDRLDCAIELYSEGVADKIIMSGDHGRTEYDEVNTMKNYAVTKGVPQASIYLDHAGFSTYDTVYRAKEIFCIKAPVIVTQKYHLYRALYNARSLGLDAYGVNSDPFRYVGQTVRDIREAAARVKDFFYCIFKPEPTYLGEKIDINSVPASATDG